MNKLSYLIIPFFISCNSFNESVLNDTKYSSGIDFVTHKKIAPKVFYFDEYTFVSGINDSSQSTIGLYFKNKEINFLTHSDGMYDTLIKANFNNDGVPDFLIIYTFEGGQQEIIALMSKSKSQFAEISLGETLSGDYDEIGGDTLEYKIPWTIKDINNDGKDEIVMNLVKMNNKEFTIPSTDTIYPDK